METLHIEYRFLVSLLKKIPLKENVGGNPCDHRLGRDFLALTLEEGPTKEKVDQLEFIKILLFTKILLFKRCC